MSAEPIDFVAVSVVEKAMRSLLADLRPDMPAHEVEQAIAEARREMLEELRGEA